MTFAIKDPEMQKKRLKEIDTFVKTHGRGDIKLTEEQKNRRMEKYLSNSTQIDKVLGLGRYPKVGIKFLSESTKLKVIAEDHEGPVDPIPADVLKNIKNHPHDIRFGENHKIVFMKVHDNGRMEIEHLIIDGKENDPKTRTMTGIMIFDDATSADNEYRQFKKGILKEVSDRTMSIHESKGRLLELLEDPNIDTDIDKEGQI